MTWVDGPTLGVFFVVGIMLSMPIIRRLRWRMVERRMEKRRLFEKIQGRYERLD
jgi:hypothetical protein